MNTLGYVRRDADLSFARGGYLELRRRLRLDGVLLASVVILCLLGLAVLFSASDGSIETVRRQGIAMGLGLVAMLAMAQLPLGFFRAWAWGFYLAGLALLGAVLLFGVEANGARSWLDFPGVPSFQPSELMKFILPLLVASFLASRPLPPRFTHLLAAVAVIAVPTALIVLQNDMGTSLMVVMSGLFVLLLAGVSWYWVSGAGLALAVASPAWYMFLAQEHQKSRILSFFDPYSDPTGAGYNIIQSQIAVGSGGLLGKGYRLGAQSNLDFIPESNTDFIFAVLAEEFGFAGVLALLALFVIVFARGCLIAYQAQDIFGRLLAGGTTLTLFLYVFVNIAMVTGLVPVIGLPLPLISRGGSSALTILVGIGLLMSVHADSLRRTT